MEIVTTDEYENLGAEFQYEIIKRLNETLKKYQIEEEMREKISGEFIFDFSMLLDQGKISDSIPCMAFKKMDKLFLTSKYFHYHEYAFGNVREVFDPNSASNLAERK